MGPVKRSGADQGGERNVEARRALVSHGLLLVERGYVVGADGNLSVRLGETVLCTPSRVPYRDLTPEAMVEVRKPPAPSPAVDSDSLKDADFPANATSELALHLAVYSARTELRALVHAHPVWACVLAVLRQPLPALLDEVGPVLGGPVAVAPYAPSGSAMLGENAARAMHGRNAVILANHGTLSGGATLEEAFYRLEVLERAAHVYLLARGRGEVAMPGA
jgi:L-fuculose-phosphate aldolase